MPVPEEGASAAEEAEGPWLGSLLGVAHLAWGASRAGDTPPALPIPPAAGALYDLEEVGADGVGWALFAPLGLEVGPGDGADPAHLDAWLRGVLELLAQNPGLGATVRVSWGFLGRHGPRGPALEAGDALLWVVPGMLLAPADLAAPLLQLRAGWRISGGGRAGREDRRGARDDRLSGARSDLGRLWGGLSPGRVRHGGRTAHGAGRAARGGGRAP